MFIFGFDVAKDTGGIKLYTSYLVYSQIWLKCFWGWLSFFYIFFWKIATFATNKTSEKNTEILTCVLFEIRTSGCLVNFISFSRVPIDVS